MPLLIPSIISYLNKLSNAGNIASDTKESLDVAIQCLTEAYPETASMEIYDLESLIQPSKPHSSTSADSALTCNINNIEKASVHKKRGNDALLSKNYELAIEEYSKAIELCPSDPIFYSNRAAAWMHMKSTDEDTLFEAENDCIKALKLDPAYAKAQARLGSVYLAQKKYQEAVEALEKALELDPSNSSIKTLLSEAKASLTGEPSQISSSNAPGSGFDFSSLLSDPNLMAMAQNFMGSDAGKGLLNNPNIAQLAQQFLGGSGGNGSLPK